MRYKIHKAICSCDLVFAVSYLPVEGGEASAIKELQKHLRRCEKKHPPEELTERREEDNRYKLLYLHLFGRSGYKKASESLSDKERIIIEMRYGIGEYSKEDKATLEKVARRFDVTRERIRQIEAKAMEKIRVNIKNY